MGFPFFYGYKSELLVKINTNMDKFIYIDYNKTTTNNNY